MTNKIMNISYDKMIEIKQELKNNKEIYWVEIKGGQCTTLPEYLGVVSDSFGFPIKSKGLDGYLDWMTDLTWVDEPEIIMVIYEFRDFLKNDLVAKNTVIEEFKEEILPWWEAEVVNYVVEGETRKMTIYLVD